MPDRAGKFQGPTCAHATLHEQAGARDDGWKRQIVDQINTAIGETMREALKLSLFTALRSQPFATAAKGWGTDFREVTAQGGGHYSFS